MRRKSEIDRDNPEWTAKDFAKAKRLAKPTPLTELGAIIKRERGRPRLSNPKEQVTLRLDADVLALYRKTGEGWQTKLNNDLRKATGAKEDKARKRA